MAYIRRKSVAVLSVALATGLPVSAEVTGRVKDMDGNPLEFATVFWSKTSVATRTDIDGRFTIEKPKKSNRLVISYLGYENDTVTVNDDETVDVTLSNNHNLDEVRVVARSWGVLKSKGSVANQEIITSAELARAACCNLGESFTTNPSVDVSYSDAATGAKQIKLLGLSGTYVQMLSENIPNYRGAAAPYALGYIPGTWMQSIQVSKGSSSVKNGYEAITGQINVEFKKPQAPQAVHANLYLNSKLKFEANVDANVHITRRLSTALLMHYEDLYRTHDGNGDGFLDMPRVEQYNIQNRWAWMGDHYVFQASVKALKENRTGGQSSHASHAAASPAHGLYRIGIKTERYEAFTKNAYIFDKEKSTNIALILSGSLHKQDAGFGNKVYNVNQKNGYASLMFETNFTKSHSLSAGLSLNHDYYDQWYRLDNDLAHPVEKAVEKETVPGAYAQYTFNLHDKLILMGGLRVDHSSLYGTFLTPRAHVKYSPTKSLTIRASAGRGYRSSHVLAENNYLFASGRRIEVDDNLEQEDAWNFGGSVAYDLPLFGKTLNLNAEYYYTRFNNQLVIDLDSNPHVVHFGNLDGKSYSHTLQVEATYPFFEGFALTAAYRMTDAKTTYGGKLLERPLTSRYKGLLTASYHTAMDLWQFDVTMQLNGGGRMPEPYITDAGTSSWQSRYHSYAQLSAQVTRHFRHFSVYVGGENLTNYTQRNPIIGASNPWGSNFDSTMIWGPMDGAMAYAGVRFTFDYE